MPAAALKLVREHPLAGVATAFVVGQGRSINDLPWLYRAILRWVFRRVKWGSTARDPENSHEIQGVFTDEDLARSHMLDGWYIHEIPVNVPLPVETCFIGKMDIPRSPMSTEYQKIECDTVAIKLCDLEKFGATIGRMEKAVNQ